MKFIKFFFIFIIVIGCNSTANNDTFKTKKLIVNSSFVINKDSLILNGNEGNWYNKGELYNGYAVKYHPNKSLKEKTGFYNGKKQGVYKVWFPNGVLKLESNYHQNVLEGSYKVWWINKNKALEVNFKEGKKEGKERQWFSSGMLSKKRNLVKGRENGLQQSWLENGKIYINYEAKNGRTFGMKRAKLCYQLKNEKIAENKRK